MEYPMNPNTNKPMTNAEFRKAFKEQLSKLVKILTDPETRDTIPNEDLHKIHCYLEAIQESGLLSK